jgi:PAS domain S-box-containing protein
MREWLCGEVLRQVEGDAPTPWEARTGVYTALGSPTELQRRYAHLTETDEALLVTNTASVIVAVSPVALRLLGHREPADLVGRRILVVVPARYHQAHIAGTTLNATNGRDKLLGVPITVPVVLADGREEPMSLVVVPRLLDDHETVFVATMTPAA